MAIDFPSSPANGQSFTAGNVTWIWDGVKWGVPTTAGSGLYLPLTGGVMTGDITLKGDPALALHPATKRYADSMVNDNRIINGDMRIDQRNNGVGGTAAGYTVDRWQYATTQVGKITWARAAASVSVGFPYCLSFGSSSAYAAAATDTFAVFQPIEADMASDFAWGTPNAQSVTLSFLVQSSLTGTFSGAIRNAPTANRSYLFTYSIPAANVMSKVVVVVPGDTGGAWTLSGNGSGVSVLFDLGSGSNLRTTAGAWTNGNYLCATGAVSVVAANGATFYLTGVKLEVGSVATPYNRQSLAKSMADCQRYYNSMAGQPASGYTGIAAQQAYFCMTIPTMRAAPTVNFTNITYNYNSSNLVVNGSGPAVFGFNFGMPVIGSGAVTFTALLSAEL